jgi:hypothetical protein
LGGGRASVPLTYRYVFPFFKMYRTILTRLDTGDPRIHQNSNKPCPLMIETFFSPNIILLRLTTISTKIHTYMFSIEKFPMANEVELSGLITE